MKKFLALLLSVAMLVIPMTAFAVELTPAIEYFDNEVTIEGVYDETLSGRIATLIVVNPGKDIADIDSDLEVIAWADQCILDENGAFIFVTDMKYTESGAGYTVYVTASGSDIVYEGTFDYDKDQVDVAYIEALNDCTLKSAMETLIISEDIAYRISQIDEDLVKDFKKLEKESIVAENMLDEKPFADMDDFVEKLRDEVDDRAKKEKDNGGGGGRGTTLIVDPELINPAPVDTNPFYDIADDFWGKDAIIGLYKKDIVAGAGDGYFRPNDTITRAEFVQMVVKAFGFGQQGEPVQFADVKNADWFAKAVQIAYSNGVVKGTDVDTFSPNLNITRQDMMVILTNAAEATGKTLATGNVNFADAAKISPYATDAVAKMAASKVVYGDDFGNVNPLANATRAEAAAMLARILEVK